MSSFVDEVDVRVEAGHGGAGAMSFRREKFIPRGGPDGGDGGRGGSVFIVASANLNTLLNFRFQRLFAAGKGQQGQGSLRTGKSGPDVTLHVPVGTVVYERADDGEFVQVADMTDDGEKVVDRQGRATADGATRGSPRRPTGRRARPSRAFRVKRRTCGSTSSCSPTWGWSGFRMPASRP